MAILSAGVLSSCGEYNKVLKSTDNEYKYEAAKSYFAKGQNSKAATLLEDLALIMKGTSNAEESAYMLAMTYYNQGDYITASHYFNTYYTTYPRELIPSWHVFIAARLYIWILLNLVWIRAVHIRLSKSCRCLLNTSPESDRKELAQNMIFELQDKLVEKEFLSALLYYDLGSYTGNTVYSSTGNNYQAAVVTAQNILREYPYTKRREDLSILILRAKYDMAKESVPEKKEDRMRETIDEYYAFINEFPESKYKSEVERIFKDASKFVKDEEN